MTVIAPSGQKGWAVCNGSYDIHPNKRRMSIMVEPDSNISDFETVDIFYWLLVDGDRNPRFDEQLDRIGQIISIDYECWVAFPSNKPRITYEVTFDPYKIV